MQTNWKMEYFLIKILLLLCFPQESCSSLLSCRRELCLLTLTLLEAGDINKRNKFLVTTVPAADIEGDVLQPMGDRTRCDITTVGALSDADS